MFTPWIRRRSDRKTMKSWKSPKALKNWLLLGIFFLLNCTLLYPVHAQYSGPCTSNCSSSEPILPEQDDWDYDGDELLPQDETWEGDPADTPPADLWSEDYRDNYEKALDDEDLWNSIQSVEQYNTYDYVQGLGLAIPPNLSPEAISQVLTEQWQTTGLKSAFVQVVHLRNEQKFMINVIFPQEKDRGDRSQKDHGLLASRSLLLAKETIPSSPDRNGIQSIQAIADTEFNTTFSQFLGGVTNPRRPEETKILGSKIYQWLIKPIESQLQDRKIQGLVFSLDRGLRGVPLAALYDGKEFLIQKYNVSLLPSFGLARFSSEDIRNLPIIAMGASQFSDQTPLPAVPLELQFVQREHGRGLVLLNQDFTLNNFKTQNQQQKFGIIHLATHGEFKPGDINAGYIQFSDQKLTLKEFQKLAQDLGWSKEKSSVDLLVLSACRTAVGDEKAELGFAGLALQTGAVSALASLWYVNDLGTLALMAEFYHQLAINPVKSTALRQSQLALLKGQVKIVGDTLILSDQTRILLSPELLKKQETEPVNLANPAIWSAFTLIGDWT